MGMAGRYLATMAAVVPVCVTTTISAAPTCRGGGQARCGGSSLWAVLDSQPSCAVHSAPTRPFNPSLSRAVPRPPSPSLPTPLYPHPPTLSADLTAEAAIDSSLAEKVRGAPTLEPTLRRVVPGAWARKVEAAGRGARGPPASTPTSSLPALASPVRAATTTPRAAARCCSPSAPRQLCHGVGGGHASVVGAHADVAVGPRQALAVPRQLRVLVRPWAGAGGRGEAWQAA